MPTALTAVTHLDMIVRGRGASSTPEESVRRMADRAGIDVPGDEDRQRNRVSGAGALLGALTGVAVGAGYGLARALGWRPSVPTAALVTGIDPREWSLAPRAESRK